MTSVDTRIRVVGERVRIQVLNVELEPDWNRSYDKWIDELAFLRDIATIFSKPTATKADMCNLAAFAREVTLGDLAYKTMSDPAAPQYHDFRDFGKISRNNLPVWVYIRELVYRSYRIPEDFTYCGVPLSSIDIAEGLLLGTDIQDGDESGAHAFQVFAQTPTIYYPPVHASAICKGQPLDLLNARDIRLFYRGATRDLSNVWSIAPQFEVDPLGKSIRFHVPTFIDGDPAEGKSIYLLPNRGEGGGTDISGDVPVDSDYLDVAVPNPDFEISPAEVRASFTFLFGRFYRDFGSGPRRGAYHSPGLDMHLIDSFSCGLYTDPGIGSIDSSAVRLPDTSLSLFQEVLYEDGGGALAKAAAVASPLLALSPTQATGGFTRHGIAGTSLSPVIDRVSVSINVPEAVIERVEFTKARSTAIPLAERTLQRIQRTEEVFSGQDALKRESREYRVLATQVSSQAKTEARARTHRVFTDVFEKPVGSEGGASALVMDRDSITFKAGDIVWLDDKGQPSTKGGTFGGIAVADTKGQQMYIAHSGRVSFRYLRQGPLRHHDRSDDFLRHGFSLRPSDSSPAPASNPSLPLRC